ncbi:hypothetical protein Q4S45_02320 [Massilia sp. R2A-15]|uniref:hypothetical protein n=1 Tax=Massilia sp. R2A-15 TaxID=3064278 RepID=UPI002733BCFB|nr:hypothetical protein [Massilia sp. R2A-15]WLI89980.1 hypothetical protein Q4S45_02320 [Massilia sp. R2A-15]
MDRGESAILPEAVIGPESAASAPHFDVAAQQLPLRTGPVDLRRLSSIVRQTPRTGCTVRPYREFFTLRRTIGVQNSPENCANFLTVVYMHGNPPARLTSLVSIWFYVALKLLFVIKRCLLFRSLNEKKYEVVGQERNTRDLERNNTLTKSRSFSKSFKKH